VTLLGILAYKVVGNFPQKPNLPYQPLIGRHLLMPCQCFAFRLQFVTDKQH